MKNVTEPWVTMPNIKEHSSEWCNVENTGIRAHCVDWTKDIPQKLLLDEFSDNQLISYCFPLSPENYVNPKMQCALVEFELRFQLLFVFKILKY